MYFKNFGHVKIKKIIRQYLAKIIKENKLRVE